MLTIVPRRKRYFVMKRDVAKKACLRPAGSDEPGKRAVLFPVARAGKQYPWTAGPVVDTAIRETTVRPPMLWRLLTWLDGSSTRYAVAAWFSLVLVGVFAVA